MEKSIFKCTPGEIVIRKSDEKHFEFRGIAPGKAVSMILVRDPFDDDGVIQKVSGLDFKPLVIGQDDPDEYDLPESHAIDILCSEIVRLKDKIEQMHYNMADGWDESDQAKLEETQQKLADCQNACKWIYDKL